METRSISTRRMTILAIAVLMIALVVGFVMLGHEMKLDKIQTAALEELETGRGTYDAQSIVLYDTNRAEAEELAEKLGASLRITKDGRFATLTLPEGVTIEDVYSSKENRELLSKFSVDYEVRTTDVDELTAETATRLTSRPEYTVTDTEYSLQTYYDYLNLKNTWAYTEGYGVTVAVIDTGIDTDHPEFAGKISEYSYNASEDKIVKDYDISVIEDEQGHGTAVAGVIAAQFDGVGTIGIAPDVTLIVIKAECDENGNFKRTSDLVFGLYYAIERDVDVVNMSFGTGENAFASATQLAIDSDIICVAAAGNKSTSELTWPAADENVIGVGALADGSWELAEYSNYGENVNVVAPGTVYTTAIGGGYGTINGTSFSSPITAGVIALYLSQNRYQEFRNVTEVLYASCYDLGDLGCDWYYGYGAVDVSALMLEEKGTVTFNYLTDEIEETKQVFVRNHTLQDIPEPDRLYAVFDGWYYDEQCTEELSLYADKFTTDLTLYASWVNEDDGVPYTYVELDDGTIEIRSYTGHRRFITIPDYINGKVVSSIGEEAFKGETRLRQVNLPKYLVRIRRSAFEGCANIIGMKIPDTVKEIGLNAFYGDTRLSYVEFGSNSTLETIGDAAFAFCGKIQRFEVPKNVKYLNGTAFFGDTGMTSISVRQGNNYFTSSGGVLFNKTASTLIAYPAGKSGTYTIPNIVREIGDCAFGYAKITEIDLDNVTTIGGSAFANSSLESVIIPDTVTSMGKEAFASNFYLKSVTLGRGLTVIPKKAFIYDFALTTITIPREIVIIDGGGMAGAFESSGLTSVTFEKNSSLAVIGDYAFSGTPLKSISIPASVMRIGGNAFGFDTSLSSVTFEQGSMLQSIGGAAFAYTYSLTTIAFPSNLREIGDYAFQGSGLDGDVTIPASLTSFGAGVFASCHDLENILVEVDNENYKDIDGVVFNINEDTLIEYPSGNTRTSYTIQSGVETVFDSAFYGSWNLTQIYLPEGLTYIQRYAFYDVENLMSMSMPDSVYMISNYAFAYDWNMSSVYFTENATLPRISYGAFAYSGLQSFRVPASVSTMAQGAFEGCKNLTSFTFAANSKLESISAYMFDGCDNLQSITFENGSKLTSIQAHGLEGMRRLTNVNFGNAALTNIDNFAFRFCESLGTLTIPSGVTYIGRYAFFGCKSMTTLTIPATVEYIGRYAFHYAENLDIYFEADDLPVYLQENWDSGIRGYYLSVSSVETSGDFRYAVLNSGNISIAEYTGTDTSVDLTTLGLGNIVTIGGHAFANSTVESITLPNTITSIHANAFSYSALKSISIPASVNFIGKEAFIGTPIETLTFASGSNLKVIEQKAFAKTTELTSVTIPKSVTTMGTGVFQESGLTTLAFENGIALEEIPQNAFYGTKITSVVIPGSVTLINHSAFRETANLTSVTFGTTNPVHIGSNVFYHSGLTSVNIPANITYIGEYAFVGLRSLTEFTVSADNPYYTTVNGLLMSKDGRKLITVPAGRTGTLTVPVSVEVIGFGAFEDSKLTSITFPVDANILTFGYRAFYNADGLTEMTIPASVVSINYYAFAMCDNLERITFADGSRLTGVYEGAFYGCKNLEDITLPDSIVEISDFAFYGCRKITEIPVSETSELLGVYSYSFAYSGIAGEFTTPETLIDIGDYAFMGTDITKLTIPDTNAETLVIGIGAFEDCNEITDITLPFIGASFEDSDITWFGYIFGAGGYEANATYVPKSLKNVRIEHTHGTIDNWGSVYSSKALSWIESIYLGEGATSIGNNAFDYCENLKSIRIPNSVTEIGSAAFSGCGITSFEIPSGVKTINSGTFSCCTSLTSIEIPSSIKSIEERAFSLCESLYKVINHSDLTFEFGLGVLEHFYEYENDNGNIAYFAKILVDKNGNKTYRNDGYEYIETDDGFLFDKKDGNYRLIAYFGGEDTVTLPENINGDLYHIYKMCGVKNVVIPPSFTSLDDYAFRNCKSLQRIEIPTSVNSIGYQAFWGCVSLIKSNLSNGVIIIGDGAFQSCVSLESIEIPSSVNIIGGRAFEGCINLKNIFFSENSQLTRIGYRAFDGCVGLTNFIIPSNVTTIDNGAFNNCINIKNMIISENITLIESGAFGNCQFDNIVVNGNNYVYENGVIYNYEKTQIVYVLNSVKEIVIPKTVADFSFSGNSGIQYVVFEEGSVVDQIGYEAFKGCTNLLSVEIPSSVTSIGYSAFYGCTNLSEIIVPNSVKYISGNAFRCCSSLTHVDIPYGVTLIEYSTFAECISLTSISLPETITEIGRSAFEWNTALSSIRIPDSVTTIGDRAFGYCYGLSNVIIGKNVNSVNENAFEDCRFVLSVENKSNLSLSLGSEECGGVAQYAKILIDKNGKKTFRNDFDHIETEDGFLFEYSDGEYCLIAYLGNNDTVTLPLDINGNSYKIYQMKGVKNVIVPNGMTHIDNSAFGLCSTLESIQLPNSIIYIGGGAFSGCRNLKQIVLPNGLTSIEGETFRECYNLTSVVIPDSVKVIGWSAFASCIRLENINLPEGIISILSDAFAGCRNLKSVNIPDSEIKIGCTAFDRTHIYEDENNWIDGCFYVDGCLMKIGQETKFIKTAPENIAHNADGNAYSLRWIAIKNSASGTYSGSSWTFFYLEHVTNLETLVLEKLPDSNYVYYLFGWDTEKIPRTLKSIVLKDGCVPTTRDLFFGITGVNIFVEAPRDMVQDWPTGWNNGNKVYYAGEWSTVDFYAADGTLMSSEIYRTSEVIRQPYVAPINNGATSKVFVGWDIDGDGIADMIPATTSVDISARAVMETVENKYTVNFFDLDRTAVLYSYIVTHGDMLELPVPTKTGYTFDGWSGYYGGTITSNISVYSSWTHDGDGHNYVKATHLPTCTEKGYDEYTCSICGDSYRENYTDPTGHTFGDWIVDTEPGCEEDGVKYHICEVCDVCEYDSILALGHEFGRKPISRATCTEQGLTECVCVKCGETYVEHTAIRPHKYIKMYVDETILGMLKGKLVDMFYGVDGVGYFYYVCSECGNVMTVEESALVRAAAASSEECSHTSGTWQTLIEATDDKPRLEVLVCDLCGKYIDARLIVHNKEYRPGDINNDGVVNNKDLTRLFQYLSDWDVEVYGMTLDINGDGKVNNKDIIRLFQYLSNWDVDIY